MWKSGSELKPRSSAVEVVVRRPRNVRCAGAWPVRGGPPWAGRSCPTRRARRLRRWPGRLERFASVPAGAGAQRRQLDPVHGAVGPRRAGRPRPLCAPILLSSDVQAARAAVRRGRVQRGHPQAGGHRTQHGGRTGQRVGDRHGHRRPRGERSAAKARRQRSRTQKVRTRSLRASSAYTRSPSAVGLAGDQRAQTFVRRSDVDPRPAHLGAGRRRTVAVGTAPPCQYIIRGSE